MHSSESGNRIQVTAEALNSLQHATIQNLRKHWQELFRRDPPRAFGPDLLRRSIAQRIQEQANGEASRHSQQELAQLLKASEQKWKIELPRRIKAGSVLVREWKSKTHRVTVLDEGFAWDGQTYPSLSEVAREITGTRWNGPRFFGLRITETKATMEPNNGR
jgi:hypothetical protein